MNEVANPNENTQVATYGDNPYASYGEEADRAGMPLLRFTQGAWKCGGSGEEIHDGTVVLIDIADIEIGWRKWSNQAIADTVSGKLAEGYRPPARGELGDHDQQYWEMGLDKKPQDPWEFFNAMPVHFLPGAIDIDNVLLVGNSKGFISAIGKLSKDYGERYRQHPGELPVTELGATSYYNKTFSRDIDVPVFKVVGWSSVDEWGEEAGATADAPSAPEPDARPGPEAQQREASPSGTGSRRNF